MPTWPPPHSWQDHEVVTAAQMNQIRDELNTLKTSINDDGSIGLFAALNTWTRYKRLTALVTVTNSAALVTLNELTIPVGANQTWFFDYTLIVTSVSNTQFQVGTPAGIVSIAYGGTGRPTPGNDATAIANNVTAPIYMGGVSAGTGILQRISGTVVTGASAGNLTMQFAEKTADANTVAIYPNSSLVAFRVS